MKQKTNLTLSSYFFDIIFVTKEFIMKLSLITASLLTTLFIIGCSSDGGTKSPIVDDKKDGSLIGYFIDSPISGLNYACGDKTALTGVDGKFSCDVMPVNFSIGDYFLGSITKITPDSKIYPQDLLGLSRDDLASPKLIKLTQFLQSLDDDHNITAQITITKEMREKFSNDSSNDPLSPDKEALKKEIPLPNPVTAMDHLRKSIEPEDYRPADTSDMSKYMGEWVGGGSGWEVRFKQNYGEFISQFAGVDKKDLPFKGEKNIMSLMVTHKTAFAFEVDKNGYIQGTGTISYDLIPNLCGLNALTNNLLNPAVNFFDKIFTLSGMVSIDTSANIVTKSVSFDKQVISAAKSIFDTTDSTAAFIGMDWASQIANEFKSTYMESKQTNDMCGLVSENPKVKGGLSVGPMSLDELLSDASVDVGKAVMQSVLTLDPTNITGFLLNVPGLTQVQYSYKGLEHGAETRKFAISGHIDDKGHMYLYMDGLLDGGSKDLTVEYTVNYTTEKPTFPVWSPFLDKPGIIYPANRKELVYNYENKNEEKKYNVYNPETGKATEKTITVKTPTLKADNETLEFPIATFKDAGTKRNNVSVWHEYEYGWNAYRISH